MTGNISLQRFKIKNLLVFILIISIFFGIFHDTLGIPGVVLVVNDFMLLACLIIIYANGKLNVGYKFFRLYILAYFLFTLFAYIINYQSIFYYLFGLRNNFRFYLFFILCIVLFRAKDIDNILNTFDFIFYVNCIVMMVQYFFMGYNQDHLGGVFGVSFGSNGSLNVFFVIITAKTIVLAMSNKELLLMCLLKCGLCIFFAALAELKLYYFEFVVILIFCFLATNFSWKKVAIVICAIVGIFSGVELLIVMYPGFAGFFSIEGATRIVTAGSYSNSDAFNRFTFIPYLNRMFMNDKIHQLIGFGLGNCDTSSVGLFATGFHKNNSWTHYDWFSAPFTYLEQGIIGLVTYIGFFAVVFIHVFWIEKRGMADALLCKVSEVTAILSIVLVLYNQSLRIEAGYLIYFVLAIPFILAKVGNIDDKRNIL